MTNTTIAGYTVIARNARDGVTAVTDILTKAEAWAEFRLWVEVNEGPDRYSIKAVYSDGTHVKVWG